MSRLYAIPDIHGRADLLAVLLEKLTAEESFDPREDKLIFLGDMIDRGPDSKTVVENIRRLCQAFPNVIALRGNHETLCIDAHTSPTSNEKIELWMWNGGGPTVKSWGGEIPHDVLEWIESLPLYHEEPGFFFSHAPAPRERLRKDHLRGKPFDLNELTWTYSPDEFGVARVHDNGVIGVCGHIHALQRGSAKPRFYDHYIFADAGCGCSPRAPLVAIEVRSRKVVTAHPDELEATE